MNEDHWGEVNEQWMNKEIEREGRWLLPGTPQEVCCRYKSTASQRQGHLGGFKVDMTPSHLRRGRKAEQLLTKNGSLGHEAGQESRQETKKPKWLGYKGKGTGRE